MPVLPFPMVPIAIGVPLLPRSLSMPPPSAIPLGTQAPNGALWQAAQARPVWGVFDASGNAVVTPDSVLEFGHRNDSEIPTFPVAPNSFSDYNKVILPFEVTLRFRKTGTVEDRTAFLLAIDGLYHSLDLYVVLTPERSYVNANLQHYEVQRRGPGGAYILTEVDLFFVQILQSEAEYTNGAALVANAQNPSALGPANAGTVYPPATSGAAAAAAATGLANTSGYA